MSSPRLSTKNQPALSITECTAPSSSSESATTKALAAVKDLLSRAGEDTKELTLSAVLNIIERSDIIDDRKILLEQILSFMTNHPSEKVQDLAQSLIIKTLYSGLAHPPPTSVDDTRAFRTADGSCNHPEYPDLGKAGTPYARFVEQAHPLPRNQLPDPGLVFDTLLRRDQFQKHPGGLSSLMFSFAALVVYSVFRTDHKNPDTNRTSSYIDLAPLYGDDQQAQDMIRIKDGRGCLHPDTFAEDRLLLIPPAASVILVLFNRNHNYIARRLLEINERRIWVDPSTLPPNSPNLLKQEEEIFQIARLCNCAWFASVIFSDYFSAILGLVRKGSSWGLQPFGELRTHDHGLFERNRGNACSAEFNYLYRWHTTTSLQDESWIRLQSERLFLGRRPEEITLVDFYKLQSKIEATQPGMEHWIFGDLQRQEDATFKDSDLANILKNSTSHHAAAFGALGTPGIMRLNEIMGIEDSRIRDVCSFNDFRKFLGLKAYSNFEEWNPNKKVAEAAKTLYGHIDNLELYIGLQAEATRPVTDGVGLCAGYTTFHAVLSDAIALIRGDRFYTEGFTPHNLTSWGFADCQRDPNGCGFGSTFGRLLLRALPNEYDEKSVYTWFSFMHPETMHKYLRDLGKLDDYSLERPKTRVQPTIVSRYVEVREILTDSLNFAAAYMHRASDVIMGKGFFCASVDARQAKEFISALVPSPRVIDHIEEYFYKKTGELVSTASYSLINTNTKGINVVVDVFKLVPVYWAASEVAGLSLRDKTHPSGFYTPQQLYDMLGEIYQFLFLNVEPGKYMVLKRKVQGHVEELSHHIKASFSAAGSRIYIAGAFGTVLGKKRNSQNEVVKRLFELGHSNEQVVNEILALLVGVTVEVSLALTNVLNLFLDSEEHATFRAQMKNVDVKNLASLESYVVEALRIDPPIAGVSYIAKKDHTIGSLAVQRGQHLFLDVASACMNEDAFPNPTTFDATRPQEQYLRADITSKVVGADILPRLIVQVLRGIFSLENIRRGPDHYGKLQRFRDHSGSFKDLRYVYLDKRHLRSPWPTSMVVLYDVPS